MHRRHCLRAGTAILACLSLAGLAHAVVVTSSINGPEMNSGGFEAETAATLPTNPVSGVWQTRPGNTTAQVEVFDLASPGPGPAQGDKYVRLADVGGIAAQLPGLTTGTVQARLSLFYPQQSSGNGLTVQLNFSNDTTGANFGSRVTWLGMANPPDVQQYIAAASAHPAGHAALAFHAGSWQWVTTGGGATQMSIPFNKWVDLQVDLDLDAQTYTVTRLADGVTSDPLPVAQNLAVNSFAIRTNGGPSPIFYVDGIGDPDACADARSIVAGTTTGSTAAATTDGTASCGGANDVWFRYHSISAGALSLDTCGSAFDTVLSVYTGACGALTEVACSDNCSGNPCGGGASCIKLSTTAETVYWIRVAGAGGATGDFTLNLSAIAIPANDNCASPTPLTASSTAGYTLLATSEGHTASCGVSAGSPDVWYSWTAAQNGTWILDTCGSALDNVLSVYTGTCEALTEVACSAGSQLCTAGGARLELQVTAGTTYLVRVAGAGGAVGEFALHSQFGTRLVKEFSWEADGTTLPGTLPVTTAQCDGTQTHRYAADEEYYVNVNSPSVCAVIAGWPFGSDIIDYSQPGGHHLTARLRIHQASGLDSAGTEDIMRGGVGIWFLADDRFGDYREPGLAVTQTAVYRLLGRGTNDTFLGEALPVPPGFDPTASFNDYTIQYNAATNAYEYLLNGQLIFSHSRSEAPSRAATPAGLRVGDAISGRSTTLNWDISRMEYGPGVIQKTDCAGNLLALRDGTIQGATTSGEPEAWYELRPSGSGQLSLDTCGSMLDTNLAVLDACGGNVLASNSDCPGAPCGGPGSCLQLPVVENTSYRVRVSGAGGATGDYLLTVNGPPSNGICAAALRLPGAGSYTGSTAGAPLDGTATCGVGTGDVWFTYTAPSNGMATLDTCGSAIPTVLTVFTGTCDARTEAACSATCGGAPCSTDACVSWSIRTGVTYLVRVASATGGGGLFNLNLATALAPVNDDCADAQVIGLGQFTGTTVNATSEADVSSCGNTAGAGDVWYRWTSPGSGTLTVDTCYQAGMDTVVSVYTGTCGALQEIGCNDDCTGSPTCIGPSSCLSVQVTEGTTYLIRVAGNGGLQATFGLQVSADLSVAPFSEAIVVARDGGVIWQDDGFEDDTPGGLPNPPSFGAFAATGALRVLGPQDTGPGPYLGDNYLQIARLTGQANPEYVVDLNDIPDGRQLVISFAYNSVTAGPNFSIRRTGTAFPASYQQFFYFWGPRSASDAFPPAGTISYYNGTAHTPTGLTFTPGTWFTVKIVWTVGSATMDVTVDEDTVTLPVWQPAGPVDRLSFATGLAASAGFLDAAAVPDLGGCGAIAFDVDGDGDVDQSDFGEVQRCFSGSGNAYEAGCACFDRDGNGDVDRLDLVEFEKCALGPSIPADPGCDD